MVEVFRGSYIEAMNIRNLIKSNNIVVFTVNEYLSSIDPWVVAAGGNAPAILKVSDEDYEIAKKVIDDFNSGAYTLET